MKSLLEYSDAEIALILVGGGVLAALTMCLGLCGLLHGYVCVRHALIYERDMNQVNMWTIRLRSSTAKC